MSDYILYIALKCALVFMRLAPVQAWLFLARPMGWLYYYFAAKKNKKAYLNLKIAFSNISEFERKRIIKAMYIRFAQNLVEAMYLPLMDGAYIRKHVQITDMKVIEDAKKDHTSVIFLGCHAGSWELSNAACAGLFSKGSYAMLAQPQTKHRKIDSYLNRLRQDKGIRVIRVDELKTLMQHLGAGNPIGTIADHGGQDGIPVEFFGKLAMTPVGSVRLAKKMGSQIILAFMRRLHGPYHELLLKPYELVSTASPADDVKVNLANINKVFQDWVTKYPQEYLWFYKRWKYSPQKDVLILNDGKLGHLKQSLALVDCLQDLGFTVKSRLAEIKFKSAISAKFFALASYLFGPRFAGLILPFYLKSPGIREAAGHAYDMVVSAGSSLAAVNCSIAFEDNARSVSIMKPGIEPFSRFDLVIIPQHDRPPQRKNILSLLGSLNAVSPVSIKNDFQKLLEDRPELKSLESFDKPRIGLLVGGDSKHYTLTAEMADFLCSQIKRFLEERQGVIFLTTSRRTPASVVKVLRAHFEGYPACRLFVVASEANPRGAVGAIFYLSDCVIVSGESISMVSEAAASGRHVVVFEPSRLSLGPGKENNKVQRFLNAMAKEGFIYLVKLNAIYDKLLLLVDRKPEIKPLETRKVVLEGLKKIL
ncbi:MAG: mitochondrial fission ELM1 family protein [Candidatus Omnitrophica bacterium]|nr:mitochondrial fission ELM1 family protein [Candidatus Omnitrophota bacterium]